MLCYFSRDPTPLIASTGLPSATNQSVTCYSPWCWRLLSSFHLLFFTKHSCTKQSSVQITTSVDIFQASIEHEWSKTEIPDIWTIKFKTLFVHHTRNIFFSILTVDVWNMMMTMNTRFLVWALNNFQFDRIGPGDLVNPSMYISHLRQLHSGLPEPDRAKERQLDFTFGSHNVSLKLTLTLSYFSDYFMKHFWAICAGCLLETFSECC